MNHPDTPPGAADPESPARENQVRRTWRRILLSGIPPALTVLIFYFIFNRIPVAKLMEALRSAEYVRFLALMIPNSLLFFAWDTLVLCTVIRWFHGPVAYTELLPIRASSYVVAFLNTNAARGALALYLSRRLRAPFLQMGSTVIFLVLTEYTHLVSWATLGIISFRSEAAGRLIWVPPVVAAFWLFFLLYARLGITPTRALRWLTAPREWSLFRTFKIAPVRRYPQVVLLRAPMFFVSLCIHYQAAKSFGIDIPFGQMLTFLPVIFMLGALPITVAHLGTTQAAWILFFSPYATPPRLLAFSLAAHLTFSLVRVAVGVAFLPRVYKDFFGPDSGFARGILQQVRGLRWRARRGSADT
ncbi:MAG: flippase-like domain-containing protein [Acidobacteria bacterium]|nr:flippase-like domain-containing protein [Acidobacteriota bacterium]